MLIQAINMPTVNFGLWFTLFFACIGYALKGVGNEKNDTRFYIDDNPYLRMRWQIV